MRDNSFLNEDVYEKAFRLLCESKNIEYKENIIEKIKKLPMLEHFEGCTDEQIKYAQDALNLKFPQEYIDYIKEYGAISFYGHEWTGLNVSANYINVVSATNTEKNVNPKFPNGFFVLESLGIDALYIIVNENGEVYILQLEKIKFLCNSISEYIDMIIAEEYNK